MHYRMFSAVLVLYLLHDSIDPSPPVHCTQKVSPTLSNISWGVKLSSVENHWMKVVRSTTSYNSSLSSHPSSGVNFNETTHQVSPTLNPVTDSQIRRKKRKCYFKSKLTGVSRFLGSCRNLPNLFHLLAEAVETGRDSNLQLADGASRQPASLKDLWMCRDIGFVKL